MLKRMLLGLRPVFGVALAVADVVSYLYFLNELKLQLAIVL